MRPDDRPIPMPDDFDGSLILDHDLEALDAELAAAGSRARAGRAVGSAERPSTAFAQDLRARLVAGLPAASVATESAPAGYPAAAIPARRWGA